MCIEFTAYKKTKQVSMADQCLRDSSVARHRSVVLKVAKNRPCNTKKAHFPDSFYFGTFAHML